MLGAPDGGPEEGAGFTRTDAGRAPKILYVSPHFAPAWRYGGLVEAVYQFARHVTRAGAEVSVLTTDADGPLASLESNRLEAYERGDLSVRYCRRLMRNSVSIEMVRCLLPHVRWADAVHLHAAYSFPTIPTMIAARVAGKPLVWTPHGALQRWDGSRRVVSKAIWDAICAVAAPRTMVLHATSREEAAESGKRFPRAPIELVPNGVAIPASLARTERGPLLRLGFIGRLDPKKGIENLLTACRQLSDGGQSQFSLTIAGSGEPAYVEKLSVMVASLGIGSHVTLAGEVRGVAKARFFESIDVVVVPSYTENFAIVVAETLAHGAAVIASKGTPWSDVERVGCGLWVDNSPESLAEAISRIGVMPIGEMGARGREWVTGEFSWERCASKMLDCYQRMIAAGGRLSIAAAIN